MLKRTIICIALIVSFFANPAFPSGGVEYTEEDEAKAFASRFAISGGEYGSGTEAKAMLDRAAAAVKADAATAIAAFNRNDSQFRDRDLFVFCFNAEDGKFTAKHWLGRMCERFTIRQANRSVSKYINTQRKVG